jgi:hypothetical protein
MDTNTTQTRWGVINKNGTRAEGSEGWSVSRFGAGQYKITFHPKFDGSPAIVGSQCKYGQEHQWPGDGVVFPFTGEDSATVCTGGYNTNEDRDFSFIAMGHVRG